MSRPAFATSKEAKAACWFSRRHRTDEQHRNARETYRVTRGKAARQARAILRREEQA